jgi:hypothetical protein
VGKGGMQQNLDFKYGAGQKKMAGRRLLEKNRIISEKAVSVGKSYILCNVDDKTKQMYIFVWVRVCVKCYQILFFSSFLQCVKNVSSLFNTCANNNRPFHGNCGAVIGACAQTLPDGNIFLTQNGNMHCGVNKCSTRQNSAAKENGIIFFYLPQGCEEEKVLGKIQN